MVKKKISYLHWLIILISALIEAKPAQKNSDIPIAGGRSIAECITGNRPEYWDSDLYITTTELARKLGYKAEDHVVVTEDGYILTIHRIAGPDGAPPVFLQHGLFGSSFNFVTTTNRSLAFILVENGYDVWLSNSRGSMYSRCHTRYTTADREYWNFSWHEMGIYDSPAQITYIKNITKQDIIFVGYSLGATISYVMAIERPDAASKVKVLLNLAPVAYSYYTKDLFNLLVPITRLLERLTKLTSGELVMPKNAMKYFCTLTILHKKICATGLFLLYGFDYEQFPYSRFATIIEHMSSLPFKLGTHYLLERITGRFMKYDYGKTGNLKMYNSTEAPSYNISKITMPVGIFWAENDYIAAPEDVQKFYKQVPIQILNYKVKHSKFNHFDFAFAKDAPKYVYSKLLSVMKDFK